VAEVKIEKRKENPVKRSIDNGEFTIEYFFRFKKFNTQAQFSMFKEGSRRHWPKLKVPA
jgi:hypothetical protein